MLNLHRSRFPSFYSKSGFYLSCLSNYYTCLLKCCDSCPRRYNYPLHNLDKNQYNCFEISFKRRAHTFSRGMRFIEIGANLTDPMYQGVYNGNTYHSPDLDRVLDRAWEFGVQKIIITGGSLSESEEALKLALTDDRLFCTVGCHPTRCDEFEKHPGGPASYLSALQEVLDRGQALKKVVAVGEFGLDYDRLKFCSAETQKKYFEIQLALVCHSGLPMFLHMRAAAQDFAEILSRYYTNAAQDASTPSYISSSALSPTPSSPSPTSSSPSPLSPAFRPSSGVVHSFTGTLDEALSILALHPSLFIGLNGCSLRTQENLSVAAAIPSSRVMLETDCPWCEIKNTHPGKGFIKTALPVKAVDKKKHSRDAMVKSRNEPNGIRHVLEVLAGAKGIYDGGRTKEAESRLTEELAEEIYLNTDKVFFCSARV